MSVYSQIAQKIIEQQETIIGPVAVEQAQQVSGLQVKWEDQHQVTVNGDDPGVIDKLVDKYKVLFGKISVEVCKEAAANLAAQLPPEGLPQSLK